MSERDDILSTIRRNLAAAGDPYEESLPDISRSRLDGDREVLVRRLVEECEAVSTVVHLVHDLAHAARVLEELLNSRNISRLAVSQDPLARELSSRVLGNHEVIDSHADLAEIERTDMGLTGARMAIAEHGTFVLVPDDDHCRLVSLLPPQHVIALPLNRLLGTLAEALEQLSEGGPMEIPSNVTFVSGPSRTADIEQTLVTGIHGPAQLDILLVEDGGGLDTA